MKPYRLLIFAALMFAAVMAVLAASRHSYADNITVTLSDGTAGTSNDVQTIQNAIDAYLKAQGINALMPAASLWQKLLQAAQTAQSKEPPK